MWKEILVLINLISPNEIAVLIGIFGLILAIIAMYPTWIDYFQKNT